MWAGYGQLDHLTQITLKFDLGGSWCHVETMHQARGFGTHLLLHCKFYVMKMSGSMQAWITNVGSAAFCLKATGVSITEEDQILVLMNRLPPSYDSFAVSLNVTMPRKLTLSHAVICLINEYEHQASARPTPKSAVPRDPGIAAAVLSSEDIRKNTFALPWQKCTLLP